MYTLQDNFATVKLHSYSCIAPPLYYVLENGTDKEEDPHLHLQPFFEACALEVFGSLLSVKALEVSRFSFKTRPIGT